MEDKLLKYFPAEIERQQGFICGFEADIQTVETNPHPKDGFAGMEVKGICYDKKEDAGLAILAACQQIKTAEPVVLGNYRGFGMELHFDSFRQEMMLTLRSTMRHTVPLGTDARGNVQRLDNALNAIPERLEQAKNQLENLHQQQVAAEIEVTKPFPQEEELAQKSARLAELDALLNMDERRGTAAEQPEQKELPTQERRSVLAELHEKAAQLPPPVRCDNEQEIAI